jgi:hypothetical protein
MKGLRVAVAGVSRCSLSGGVLHQVAADAGRDPFAPASLSTSVNRQTLQEILAAGLGRRIRFGAELTGFDADGDGVRLDFAGGRHAR